MSIMIDWMKQTVECVQINLVNSPADGSVHCDWSVGIWRPTTAENRKWMQLPLKSTEEEEEWSRFVFYFEGLVENTDGHRARDHCSRRRLDICQRETTGCF